MASLADARSPLPEVDSWDPEIVSVAVLGQGEVLDVHGPRDRPFHWASLTKSCTAFTILRLVDDGVVGLDEPAGPGDRPARGATIRHLLAHASGSPFEAGEASSEVGHRRHYSNLAYVSLGRFVERRLGRPFAAIMDDLLLRPLGMKSAELRGSSAGGLYGSLQDLINYCLQLSNPTLISPASFAEATTCQFPDLGGRSVPLGDWYDPFPWGLGYEIKAQKQRHWMGALTSERTFGHSGGSGSYFWIDPDAGLACAVLSSGRLGEWARAVWPRFSDDVYRHYAPANATRSLNDGLESEA